MDLDRNINTDGKGKYALINLRKLEGNPQTAEELVAAILKNPEAVEFGRVGESDEFFVMKLKDRYSMGGLWGYADAAKQCGDSEYANAINNMVERSGPNHPLCKKPD